METADPHGGPQPSIEELLAARLSVTSLKIQGATRTNADLLNAVIHPVMSTGGSFEGVIEDVSKAVDRLRTTNCFKSVDAYLDTTPAGDASVLFTVSEKSLYQLHTGTTLQTSGDREASLEGSFLWRNLRGHADTLKASVGWVADATSPSFSSFPSTSWDIEYVRPFVAGLDTSLVNSLRGTLNNHTESSSYSLYTRKAESSLFTPIGSFSFFSAWRQVANVDLDASPVIVEDAGHSWKTALQHTIDTDSRDHGPMPTSGLYARLQQEITIPLGDISLSRFDASTQFHLPFGGGPVLSLAGRTGAVFSQARTRLPDRLFLGGPNSLRGFCPRGVGPRDGKDAVGGDAYYALTAMFSLPLPAASLLSQLFRARFHLFATAGDVAEMDMVRQGLRGLRDVAVRAVPKKAWEGIAQSARVAVGLGVALETAVGRVEVNYCHALRSATTDEPKAGIQIGISESFS